MTQHTRLHGAAGVAPSFGRQAHSWYLANLQTVADDRSLSHDGPNYVSGSVALVSFAHN